MTNNIEVLRGWLKHGPVQNHAGKQYVLVPVDELDAALATLRAELDGLRADAERWQWFKRHCVRTCSLDVGGQHGYCVTEVFGRIAGPNINAAIDAARNQENDNG